MLIQTRRELRFARSSTLPWPTYNANAAAYNNTIFVNTPITADSAGNIYFGFRVQGTAPAPLNTSQSGFARIDSNGNGIHVLAGAAANDILIDRDSHNLAPALSNDESTRICGREVVYRPKPLLLAWVELDNTRYQAFRFPERSAQW